MCGSKTTLNDSKREMIGALERIKSDYESIHQHLVRDRAINSRIMYGAIKKEIESSMSHVKRQIHWITYEQEEVS